MDKGRLVARPLVWVILDRIGRSASRPLSPDSDRIADNIGGRQFRIFRISLDGQVESGLLQFGPASSRGAFRDRHGRRARDAVDALATQDERRFGGRRSRVVLTPRRWRQACGRYSAGDGGKKARSPGRARRKPLKPLRREGRMFSVNLW